MPESRRAVDRAVSQLAVLDAGRSRPPAEIDRIHAQGSRYADAVALFQALGEGWKSGVESGMGSGMGSMGSAVIQASTFHGRWRASVLRV